MELEQDIFKKGSTTYYWSSKFFPAQVRPAVFRLYSFVRVVDDYVDQVPPDEAAFELIENAWHQEIDLPAGTVASRVLNNMRAVSQHYGVQRAWVDDFLQSMRWDVEGRQYERLEDSLEYVYGSAEVIGLSMAAILELPPAATAAAKLQGRAMQWINFCRDIQEDLDLGRCYFPTADLRRHELVDLHESTTRKQPAHFRAFMTEQLDRYDSWQQAANKGYQYIPRRFRIPVQTARDMYNWTADQIRQDPFVVYERKVKPTKSRVVGAIVKASLHG